MNRKELITGIWLMSMTLLSLCSYTVFYVAKMLPRVFSLAYMAISLLSVSALIIYMWGYEKLKSMFFRWYTVSYVYLRPW